MKYATTLLIYGIVIILAETQPVACIMRHTRTRHWDGRYRERCSRWTHSAVGIGAPRRVSKTNGFVPSCFASTRPVDIVWPIVQQLRDRRVAMDR